MLGKEKETPENNKMAPITHSLARSSVPLGPALHNQQVLDPGPPDLGQAHCVKSSN